MTDMVIGCYDNYNWDILKYYVNSVDRCGFHGYKVMIVMNSDKSTVEKLQERKWNVIHYGTSDAQGNFVGEKSSFTSHVLRFFYLSHFLRSLDEKNVPDNIIFTDVRDVVFQVNPFKELPYHADGWNLVACSESIKYQYEPWGYQNILDCFGPIIQDQLKNKLIYNVGVIAAKPKALIALSDLIFQLSLGRKTPIVDQAVYNYILNNGLIDQHSIIKLNAGLATMCGTTADPRKLDQFKPHLCDDIPILSNDLVCGPGNHVYPIVHQWDRVPEFATMVKTKYEDTV